MGYKYESNINARIVGGKKKTVGILIKMKELQSCVIPGIIN